MTTSVVPTPDRPEGENGRVIRLGEGVYLGVRREDDRVVETTLFDGDGSHPGPMVPGARVFHDATRLGDGRIAAVVDFASSRRLLYVTGRDGATFARVGPVPNDTADLVASGDQLLLVHHHEPASTSLVDLATGAVTPGPTVPAPVVSNTVADRDGNVFAVLFWPQPRVEHQGPSMPIP